MNGTCGALTTEISDALVNVGPTNSSASQLFHFAQFQYNGCFSA